MPAQKAAEDILLPGIIEISGEMSTLKRIYYSRICPRFAAITYIFFFDPIAEDGYQVQGKGKYTGKNLGRLELLSMNRRDESNVDEFYKLGSLGTFEK